MDFYKIEKKRMRNGNVEIYPDFLVCRSKDLMVRGHSFYAVYDEETGFWSTSPYDLIKMIDNDLRKFADSVKEGFYGEMEVRYMKNFSSRTWKDFCEYLNRLPDNFVQLDSKPIFLGYKPEKKDYVSKQLPYSLSDSEPKCWNELVGYLYEPEEMQKIEWVIGSIVSGDSIKIQKFAVFFGAPGTGKSTVLDIIQKLFDGYWAPFDSKELASAQNNSFALEAFKDNPLIGIEHEGDLSRITDNSKLNSVVSHESMLVNEKHKPKYNFHFNTFLIMASNKPVKITDAKAGTIRRLIDIYPKGVTLPESKYWELYEGIDYELGSIANKCLNVYKSLGKSYFNGYKPLEMQDRTDAFFNFVKEHYDIFNDMEYITLKQAFSLYKKYIEEYCSNKFNPVMFEFRDDLKDYFDNFDEDLFVVDNNGKRLHLRSVYSNFKGEKIFKKFNGRKQTKKEWLEFKEQKSLLDDICKECPAQYSNRHGVPSKPWKDVKSVLGDLDTTKEHYVQVPSNMIVIDFDIKDESGEKSYELNLAEAKKWSKTYAELSKSGKGIHLHYFYDGDPTLLSRDYADSIEVKVFTGNSALRRKVTQCNDIQIATISSGLALKQKSGRKMNEQVLKDEKHLRSCIIKALKLQVWPNHKPSIDYIDMILTKAYDSGMVYNVEDMRNDILTFAFASRNQSEYCVGVVKKLKLKSESESPPDLAYTDEDPIMLFDVEVYPNLFIFCYKKYGSGSKVVRLMNPSAEDLTKLIFHGNKKRWVGFNCRRYDNHIVYARTLGYTNEMLFDISQRIINEKNDRGCFFGEAYNLSWADIYDYADVKQSLKKWEIELGIHHQEMDWPWDQPIPEELWEKAADYCCNDVLATEAVFDATQEDLTVRKILAELSGLSINDPSRLHTTKIIFGDDKKPELVYTDLSEMFPGYTYSFGHSNYRGEDPGEGGYVFAVPGMYGRTPVLDVASMHPSSIIALNLFGKYTDNFKMLKDIRILIKHKEFDKVAKMFDGKLANYLTDESTAKKLSKALKLVINSVYGYTTAKFANPFKDPRNIDNIVAKRGALFMIDLKHIVQDELNYPVAHIKTDSIKIPGADQKVVDRVVAEGKKYGYDFEIEEVFEKFCLVNDAVFVGKEEGTGEWITTGAQFQVPYVKKTLFTHEPLIFDDFCVTRAVKTSMYLEFEKPDGTIERSFVGKVGRFCPMKTHGGRLVCARGDDKFNSVTDSKDWLWLESEVVKRLGYEDDIDYGYFESKAIEAKETISQFGDFEEFVS
ncbi:MAG: hypothetical protein J6U54_17680 [Clostridiales bacterium]|nr:hypothetical protein [Clostridiales bacterium]